MSVERRRTGIAGPMQAGSQTLGPSRTPSSTNFLVMIDRTNRNRSSCALLDARTDKQQTGVMDNGLLRRVLLCCTSRRERKLVVNSIVKPTSCMFRRLSVRGLDCAEKSKKCEAAPESTPPSRCGAAAALRRLHLTDRDGMRVEIKRNVHAKGDSANITSSIYN